MKQYGLGNALFLQCFPAYYSFAADIPQSPFTGGLVLGTGGDNSDRALGIFYEGALTTGYTSPGIEDAVQANIVSAGYAHAPP